MKHVLGLNMSMQCQNSNDRCAQIRYVCGGFRSNSVTSLMAIVLILLIVCDVFSLSKNLMSNHGLLAVHLFKIMMNYLITCRSIF